MNWKEKLSNIVDKHDNVFGQNFDLSKSEITSYLKKLEKLGCFNILIENFYSVKLTLPAENQQNAILLTLLTDFRKPRQVKFNKKKNQLVLEWYC